ncbi:hypothetical protein C8A05DRAFT_36354 [Staphylotrichum tortipilum]|uniref:Uncharacterized protein n=1 Tax=Staphylotrichum tortipilum TaxID=2831512 RepID=A0AAN6RQT1_9PEZI|nr:hypothetical protein C8A05DRAFT_36354 [Staphylotrichum longicolle]
MSTDPAPQPLPLPDLLLHTGILILKILTPMLWLQSKLSPLQFLIGGAALILATLLLDPQLPRQDPDPMPAGGRNTPRSMTTEPPD